MLGMPRYSSTHANSCFSISWTGILTRSSSSSPWSAFGNAAEKSARTIPSARGDAPIVSAVVSPDVTATLSQTASDPRDGLQNTQINASAAAAEIRWKPASPDRRRARQRVGLPGVVVKKAKSRLLGDHHHRRGHADFRDSALVHRP